MHQCPKRGHTPQIRVKFWIFKLTIEVQFSCSVMSDSLRPRNCSTPVLPVHQVGDAIQPSHPLSTPSPPALNLSQHQGLFQGVSSSHSDGQSIGVSASASVLPINIQGWLPLGWTGWISLQSKGLLRVFSNTTVQMHQFFGTLPSSQSNSHTHTWPQEKP